MDRQTKIFLILFIILVTFSSFGAGLVLKSLLVQEQLPPAREQPEPNKPSNPEISEMPTNYKFLPGKHYIEDTVMLISKAEPHEVLVATNVRLEQEGSYLQNSRVSFFNGKKWQRKIKSQNTKDSLMYADNLIKNWETSIDPSRVLRESTLGKVHFNDEIIQFSTGTVSNEISVRSLPSYTKFISKGDGRLSINGKEMSAYVLYTRVYSLNAKDIQFYDAPLGLTTMWAAFWDNNNNLYFLDATEVKNPVPTYQTHKLAVLEDSSGRVSKTFEFDLVFNNESNPSDFKIQFSEPISSELSLTLQNSLNKATKNSQTWFFGQVSGEVVNEAGQIVPGIGLIEFIKD